MWFPVFFPQDCFVQLLLRFFTIELIYINAACDYAYSRHVSTMVEEEDIIAFTPSDLSNVPVLEITLSHATTSDTLNIGTGKEGYRVFY